jgi:cytochrome c
MKTFAISALTVLGFALASVGSSSAADVEAGKAAFNKCKACHEVGEGAKNKVGPDLNGLEGRKAGTEAAYAYSDAMKNSGITWDQKEFEEYIRNPKAKVPGVKMVFAGITKQSELDNLWAYISQFDKDGKVAAK